MNKKSFWIILSAILVLSMLTACGGAAAPAKSSGPVTITVWDYYGEATPIKPLVDAFEKENPDIKVDYQPLDWDTTLQKLNVVFAGGTPPDVATMDMTWLPKFAALGALSDLTPLSGGKVNGKALSDVYTAGSMEAMTYNNQVLTMMYDFDVYAMYYRADLFEAKGIAVPKTWDELQAALKKLAEGDKYLYEYDADTFHGAQWIYENGGHLLSTDNKTAAFNSPEAVQAIEFYSNLLLKDKTAVNWTKDQGERIQGVKDGRIAVFSDGPYYMGIMKSSAPEMAGQWKVAIHPYSKNPGSYLGGTGLIIPQNAKNKEAAWKFIEFALRTENEIGVYKFAGAAPATIEALNSPEVNVADPYFGGEKAFSIFLDSMKTAHPFPYVRQWSDIDTLFTTAMQEIALGQKSVKDVFDDAATKTNDALTK